MGKKCLEINLFGACVVRAAEADGFEITGSKHRALFVLLATAPFGRRTRSFLQETLWGAACYDTGRQSLRRALSDIRHVMGDRFGEVLACTNADISLDLTRVTFLGRRGDGDLLEGLDVREPGFVRWLGALRAAPDQLDALYSAAHQPPRSPVLPSIAVLPFNLVSGATHHIVLGDWLAEEISRSLARSRLMAVISHLSSRQLGGARIDLQSIRGQLGVDYCVTGSLRVTGGEIVLDADFVDTSGGRILWTRQFAGALEGYLDRFGRGVGQIVETIGRTIADEALAHVASRALSDLEDHRLLIGSVSLMHRPTLREFARSRELIEEVLRRSPRAAEAHAWHAKWYSLSVFNGWSADAAKDIRIAADATARALDIDPDSAFCLTIDGFVHNNLLRRLDVASQRYDQALSLNPNESLSWLLLGALQAFEGQAKSAIESAEKARRLSPIDPFQYYYESLSATAYLAGERYEDALTLAESSWARHDRHVSTLRAKITALHYLGRTAEARAAGAELLRRQPQFTVDAYRGAHPAGQHELGRRVAAALSAAGIP